MKCNPVSCAFLVGHVLYDFSNLVVVFVMILFAVLHFSVTGVKDETERVHNQPTRPREHITSSSSTCLVLVW